MRIVVIGGTGLIGSKLVPTLLARGHDAVAASRRLGVDAVTGTGLAEALAGAAVVVDVSDSPSFEDAAVMEFFTVATRTLLEHEAAAGVQHHVALSVVGTERLVESGYFRAKAAQEALIRASTIPYSIVRAAQFFEFLKRIPAFARHGHTVRLPPALVQPIAADDVAKVVADVAVAAPLNGIVEVGGAEQFYLDGLVQRILGATGEPPDVIADERARYFGAELGKHSLMADEEARLGETTLDEWLRGAMPRAIRATGSTPDTRQGLQDNEFRLSDVPAGSVLVLGNVAVFSVAGGFCATQATCPHRGGALSEGTLDGTTITCPLHGSQFDVWTGALLRGPAKASLRTYGVVVDGEVGRVQVDEQVARST